MEDYLEVCCGLDVHKKIVVACLLKGRLGIKPREEIREFSTLISGLNELRDWLVSENCSEVAMESTGVYWFQLYNVLEAAFDGKANITVTNPQHMKNVPGKKTDVNDALWIACLLRAGLLRKSYIPPRDIRELRDLTRYRRTMVQEMASQKNRIEKHLQLCGIKLSTFLTDICGLSGMSIIKHLCQHGFILPSDVLGYLHGVARNKVEDIKLAVNGRLTDNQRDFLKMLVDWHDKQLEQIADIEQKMDELAEKYEAAVKLVTSIPCIERISALTIISEIGVDLTSFEKSSQLCAWAGLCPGNNKSAGKVHSTRILHGNPYIKTVLCQCAWAMSRKKNFYLANWFWKIKQKRGMKKAVIALAHKIMAIVFVLLTTGGFFDEKAFDQTREKQEERRKNRIIAEARKLGLELAQA
jgi:transposase